MECVETENTQVMVIIAGDKTPLHACGHLNASELRPVSRGRGWDVAGNYIRMIVESIAKRTR